jgi:ABC-2 type transport system permease protein
VRRFVRRFFPLKDVYGVERARRVVFVMTAGRVGRPAVGWGLLFGATIASSASSYVSLFPTVAQRVATARAMQNNTGFAALFGPLRRIDTVAGYTSYKTLYFVLILGAIWGLLVATRVLRGEEDAGRWEIFLSGRTTRSRAALHASLGLGVGVIVVWALMSVFAVAVGTDPDVGISAASGLFFATALVSGMAMFMAVGMVTSQLAATRHDANLIGAGILAGSYLVRMVADSASQFGWLRWASPLGWIEELRPLTGSKPLAFIPIVALTVICVAVTLRIASQRDLGASPLASRNHRAARTLLLGGHAGLSIRLTRTGVAVWLAALAVIGLIFGLVTQAAAKALTASSTLDRVITRLGANRVGAVTYLGFVFLMAAGIVAIAVAGQISALRNEEANGHLDNLLVRRVARWKWLAVRAAIGVGLVVVGSVLVGLCAWVGAASQSAGLGIVELLKAGLNVSPPAIFVLGIGVLAFGVLPRYATPVVYGLVVWSFFVEVIASVFDSNHWLRDTSPLLHIAPAPAAPPNWTSASVLIALGLLACAAGIAAFSRRDVVGA